MVNLGIKIKGPDPGPIEIDGNLFFFTSIVIGFGPKVEWSLSPPPPRPLSDEREK